MSTAAILRALRDGPATNAQLQERLCDHGGAIARDCAKLIVRGKDRAEAISRMRRALDMFIVEGIHTSIPLHKRILDHPDFIAGNTDTKFMERMLAK